MKIAIISNLYPPFTIGGYEKLCGKVCDELAELGHEIVVLTSSYGVTDGVVEGKGVERRLKLLANEHNIYQPLEMSLSDREAIKQNNIKELLDFDRRHNPDIWFAWNLYFFDDELLDSLSSLGKVAVLFLTDNWLVAARNPNAMGQFFARHVHGREPFRPTSAGDEGATTMPQWAIFGSRFVRDLYKSFGFVFQREAVIHNGVQLPMIPPELFIRRAEPREPGKLKILFAGRVVDIKGPQLIVAALPLIQARTALKVSLTIVGDTQDEGFAARLKKDIAASSCAASVTLRGPVSEALLLTLFNDHDIYVFPSLYEPFSLTLIHAIGAGIPTVATNIGGNGEIVRDGETGLLFDKDSTIDLAQAVLRIADDPQLRSRLSHTGRRLAQRFTFRRMITRIESELMKALA